MWEVGGRPWEWGWWQWYAIVTTVFTSLWTGTSVISNLGHSNRFTHHQWHKGYRSTTSPVWCRGCCRCVLCFVADAAMAVIGVWLAVNIFWDISVLLSCRQQWGVRIVAKSIMRGTMVETCQREVERRENKSRWTYLRIPMKARRAALSMALGWWTGTVLLPGAHWMWHRERVWGLRHQPVWGADAGCQ